MSWSSQNSDTLDHDDSASHRNRTGSSPLPGVSATATGSIGLEVQPQIDLYDVAGPNVEADADLGADVNFSSSPYFTLTPSITLKAGLELDILDGLVHGSLEVTLGTFGFTAYEIASPPNATLTLSPQNPTITPGDPLAFSATRSDGQQDTVTWSLSGAENGDSITQNGVLTAAAPTGRTLTVIARDSTGATGETTVSVGSAFDPVGDLSAEQESDSLNVDVSWQAPQNTGSGSISSYTVTTSGGVPTQITTGTGVTLTNLHPGVTYVVTVYPTNTVNQTGPAATTSFDVIPLCTDTFTGGANGSGTEWNTASNWSGGYVPGLSDWVCVSGFNVTLPVENITVEGLQQSNGDLTLPSGGSLNVANALSMIGGLLSGPGTVTVPSSGSLTIGGGAELTDSMSVVNDGTAVVQGGGGICPVDTNNEYASWCLDQGTSFENAGSLTLEDHALIYGGGMVNDAGETITYDGGSDGVDIDADFDNQGSVDVTGSGGLSVGSNTIGVSDSGSYSLAPAATMIFDGNRTLAPGATFSGGTLDVGCCFNGSVTVDSMSTFGATPPPIVMGGGTLTLPSHTSSWSFPSITMGGDSANLVPSGPLTVQSLSMLGGVLSGPGTVTVPSSGSLTIGGGAELTDGMSVVNDGTAVVQGGGGICPVDTNNEYASWCLDQGTSFENAGSLTLEDHALIYGGGMVNDAGATITYDGGSDGVDIDADFDNQGSVDVTGSGGLSVGSNTIGVSDSGSYSLAPAATMIFDGNRTLAPGATFSGGTLDVGCCFNGSVTVDSMSTFGATPPPIVMGGGTLTLPSHTSSWSFPSITMGGDSANLVPSGPLTVQNLSIGGRLSGSGTVTVPSGGSLTFTGGAELTDGANLVNDGSAEVQSTDGIYSECLDDVDGPIASLCLDTGPPSRTLDRSPSTTVRMCLVKAAPWSMMPAPRSPTTGPLHRPWRRSRYL